jgi:hypothetical protein
MCEFNCARTRVSNRSHLRHQAPIEIYSDGAPQGDMAHNTLHVLGFGLAGAILANALVLVYFLLP